ncbi:DNA-methyltransferase [Stakelama pacifica]|uniref:Methyltransferase n=1 Tax=Stakelama pacifica TaxID=517720 RepID=A0A4R6FK12_9SPHN|nr:site-specific DNA-methyltransferase [Stakelama pacifica]TDN81753.1 site-specific DNA-methyltransferase (adenine-specific) [Stakelama pacifica]GGO96472.1 methyltransferase [Stakelama pacifica]
MSRVEHIGNATLYLGDCLEIMPTLGPVDHIIMDPPYEAIMHASKGGMKGLVRPDGSHHWKPLDFAPIDEIRDEVITWGAQCDGWFIAFCTSEGVGRWADGINPSPMRYKRACVWVKPDSTPQMNGQGPAQGAEHFVCAWAGQGFARWNAGGKRGVYTHCVNSPEREGTHPTEKPRRLMSEIIADFTNTGQTILDPFMGSGTTGVAAVMADRRFIGIELQEHYFDIAARRIEEAQKQGDLFIPGAAA